jgi:hypothetical protein
MRLVPKVAMQNNRGLCGCNPGIYVYAFGELVERKRKYSEKHLYRPTWKKNGALTYCDVV